MRSFRPGLRPLLRSLNRLEIAHRILVFGSVARGDRCTHDLDLLVRADDLPDNFWCLRGVNHVLERDLAHLLALQRQHPGVLDVYLLAWSGDDLRVFAPDAHGASWHPTHLDRHRIIEEAIELNELLAGGEAEATWASRCKRIIIRLQDM